MFDEKDGRGPCPDPGGPLKNAGCTDVGAGDSNLAVDAFL